MQSIVKRYLESSGTRCPFCGSEQIETDGSGGFHGLALEVDGQCHTCKRQWRERYSLATIQEAPPFHEPMAAA